MPKDDTRGAAFEPDPDFRANDYLRLWIDLGLPLSRSVAPYQAEIEIDRLHRLDHVPAATIEAAIRRLAAAKRQGYRALRWAWQRGPQALRVKTPSGDLRVEAVLAWQGFDDGGAATRPGAQPNAQPPTPSRQRVSGRELYLRRRNALPPAPEEPPDGPATAPQ